MDHTVRAFDVDLGEVARKVVEMGRLVKQQIEDATEAMRRHDVVLAERVAAADRQSSWGAGKGVAQLRVTVFGFGGRGLGFF